MCRIVLQSNGNRRAICEAGYFRHDRPSGVCHANCTSCTEDTSNCLAYKENFYMSTF